MYFSRYFFLINCVTYIYMGWDKLKAKTGGWRVSVFLLLLLNFAGGFVGGWTGMLTFRHKTSNSPFIRWMWLCTGLWILILGFFYYYK
ncbi:MAG: DUF1294 domain-containing protein [Sphingobacteriales bacterium]|jgi:uncharacterized membrane protein YsdA (DUF1294 family)|nr:DUF1294 domain-containing protein [Sphingobacteriales bacterium]